MANESRRVKMTKRLLHESLLEAMERKPISRITVKEICESADVNRSTYYVYFKDPYDQLEQLETAIIQQMASYLDTSEPGAAKPDDLQREEGILKILEYIDARRKTFEVLFGPSGDPGFQRKILSFFGSSHAKEHRPETFRAMKKAYQYIFSATGTLGMIIDWVLHEDTVEPTTLAKWINSFTGPFRE